MEEVIEFQLRLAEASNGLTRDMALKTLACLQALSERVIQAERKVATYEALYGQK